MAQANFAQPVTLYYLGPGGAPIAATPGEGFGQSAFPWTQLMSAPDLQQAITYLDAGGADERQETVTWSSAELGLTFTETYTYAGSAGNYRVALVAREQL